MTGATDKKTDVLNLRLDPGLAAEIQRIAEWRGESLSEVARELMGLGVRVERLLEAQELERPYEWGTIERDGSKGRLVIEARWHWYTQRELEEMAFPDEG